MTIDRPEGMTDEELVEAERAELDLEDDDDLDDQGDDALKTRAKRIADDLDDEGDDAPVVEAGDDEARAGVRETSSSAASEPDFGAIRGQIMQAAAQDFDLQLLSRPDLQAELVQKSPQEYIRWQARASEKYRQLEMIGADISQRELAAQEAKLKKARKDDFGDAKRAPAIKAEIRDVLKAKYRFTDAEINGIGDHRLAELAHDIAKFHRVMKTETGKKAAGKSGGSRKSARIGRAIDRGDLHAAADLIAATIH